MRQRDPLCRLEEMRHVVRSVAHFRIHEIRVVSSDPVPAMKGSAPGGIRP
jgi:hypothetical protein